MAKFGIYFDAFVTAATVKTAASLHADAAGEEGEIVEAIMTGSGSAAPADRQHRARLVRATNATPGTGTAQVPELFQGAGNAAKLASIVEFSAEPGALATVYPVLWGFNQRGGMRWSVPRGEGLKIRNADTNLRGLFQVLSDAAGEVDGSVHHWED